MRTDIFYTISYIEIDVAIWFEQVECAKFSIAGVKIWQLKNKGEDGECIVVEVFCIRVTENEFTRIVLFGIVVGYGKALIAAGLNSVYGCIVIAYVGIIVKELF